MSAPNTDKPLSASDGPREPKEGEQKEFPNAIPGVGEPKTEDRQYLRPLFSMFRSLQPACVGRPPSGSGWRRFCV